MRVQAYLSLSVQARSTRCSIVSVETFVHRKGVLNAHKFLDGNIPTLQARAGGRCIRCGWLHLPCCKSLLSPSEPLNIGMIPLKRLTGTCEYRLAGHAATHRMEASSSFSFAQPPPLSPWREISSHPSRRTCSWTNTSDVDWSSRLCRDLHTTCAVCCGKPDIHIRRHSSALFSPCRNWNFT